MKKALRIGLFTVSFLVGTSALNAGLVFDNGAYGGDQVGRFHGDSWTMFEDFTLSSPATISSLFWSTHDQPVSYTNTDLTFYSTATPTAGFEVFSGTFAATRTANATGTLFGDYSGFDYLISGLSVSLGAGTYSFSLHNNVTGGGTTWDQTLGNGSTIAGRWQSDSGVPGTFFGTEDSVFQLSDGAAQVPEPATSLLLGAGLLVVCAFSRRIRKG